MLKAKQKLLKWPEVRAGGEAVMQNYGVKTLNRDRQPLEKKGDVSFILDLRSIIIIIIDANISAKSANMRPNNETNFPNGRPMQGTNPEDCFSEFCQN